VRENSKFQVIAGAKPRNPETNYPFMTWEIDEIYQCVLCCLEKPVSWVGKRSAPSACLGDSGGGYPDVDFTRPSCGAGHAEPRVIINAVAYTAVDKAGSDAAHGV
jgi:hypothetical protein